MSTRLTKPAIGPSLLGCVLVNLIVAVLALGTSVIALAETPTSAETCGVQTLRGSYLFATQGFNITGGVAVPKAIVEGIDFNGDGTLTSPFATVSINGNIFRSSGGTGSYTVNPDCTGTITFSMGPSFDIFV